MGLVHPVVLCGGSGTRLWPLSRRTFPKQFLPLAGEQSLLAETLRRVSDSRRFAAPTLLAQEDHRFLVGEEARQAGVKPRSLLVEPVVRNTAAAICAAALDLAQSDPKAVALVLPSDHLVKDTTSFTAAVERALPFAEAGRIMTFGIKPSHPETGFGYIKLNGALGEGVHNIDAFVEKPDRTTAEGYLATGGYLWNAGLFLFRVDVVLDAYRKYAPDILKAVEAALAAGAPDLDFRRLGKEAFAGAPSQPFDIAIMEKTDKGGVVPVDMGWSDVGCWEALWHAQPKDANGNVTRGDVVLQDSHNSYVHGNSRLVCGIGIDNLVVVETDTAVLVAPMERSQEVKALVDSLAAQRRNEADEHNQTYRPWGWYRSIDRGGRYQVKHISVKPGASLSLQMHHHRAEHWVVVSGTARTTRGDRVELVHENESVYIRPGEVHRLENPGKVQLELIEVQSGSYLGEDDIVRFNDNYGRS